MIKQAYISSALAHFAKDFLSYYGLSPYNDRNKPALFWGLYTRADKNTYLKHKAFRLLQNGSIRDYDKAYADLADGFILPDGLAYSLTGTTDLLNNTLTGNGLPNNYKRLNIAIKDYSEYKVVPLGNRVYMYMGLNGDKESYYNDELRKHIPNALSAYGKTNKQLREDIYPNTYAYVKNVRAGGNTTKWELMLMGRDCIEAQGKPIKDVLSALDSAKDNDPYRVREKALERLVMDNSWLSTSYWV